MILAAIGFYYSNFYLLLLALFLIGVQATFFGPVKYAILPEQLYKNELIPGTALIEASTFLAILIGTLLGGLFIGIPHGAEVVSLLILFVAILGLSTSFAIPKATVTQARAPLSSNIIQETIKVIRYALQQPRIYFTIMGISWFWLVGATFLMLLALFTKEILHADSTVVTLFLSIFSIGIGIGSYVCTGIQKGRIDTNSVLWAIIGVTIFIVDLFFASSTDANKSGELLHFTVFFHTFSHWHISLDFLCIAVCSGIYVVPLYTLLQTQTEPAHRARIIAANNIFNALFMVLSSIASMCLLSLGLSILHLFLFLGIVNAAVAIILKKNCDIIKYLSSVHFKMRNLQASRYTPKSHHCRCVKHAVNPVKLIRSLTVAGRL